MKSTKKMSQVFVFTFLSSIALNSVSTPAYARTTAETAYSPGEVWSTAIRFLRIDRGFQILERDAEASYVLFGYVDGQTKARGAFEILSKRDEKDRLTTILVINIPDVPHHVERLLLDKLDRKLREELGSPSPTRRDPPRDGDGKDDGKSGRERDDKDKKRSDGKTTKGDLPRAEESDIPQAEHRKELPR
ncbi:MAG: hypothetical protein SGI86_12440 [Deltaproteobacteria bacterium]|nr:hypothetical protein [Deltaproteobacteria bacterium]